MLTTMIVDDDRLVRLGLRDLLDGASDMHLVAEAVNGVEAVEKARNHKIDVALVDVRMPKMNGIEATQRLRALPDPPRVIILTTFELDEYVYDSLRAGADGFLLKDIDPQEILHAMRLVAGGESMLHPRSTRALIDHFRRSDGRCSTRARKKIGSLTPRERDVLALVAEGATNADIAQRLNMREATVKAHVSRILTALDAGNRVQAALAARDAGLQH